MNLFEELNKVLLEDKNRQFIASIEAFTAYNHPQMYYTYSPPSKGASKAYTDAQVSFNKEQIGDRLDDLFKRSGYTRRDVSNTSSITIPMWVRRSWKDDIDSQYEEHVKMLKSKYKDKELDRLSAIESTNLTRQHLNTPLNYEEFKAIAAYGGNSKFFLGSLSKGVKPLLSAQSLDPNRVAAKYITYFASNYAGRNIDSIEDLNYVIETLSDEDEDRWAELHYFVDENMRKEHVEYEGDLDKFVNDVLNNIEKYAFQNEEVEIGGDADSFVQGMNILAVDPTADAPVRRNLTDLPRHSSDERPTVADSVRLAKWGAEKMGKYPTHSWIVITGYERSGYTGIKPEKRTNNGRMVGECPYCDGNKYVGLDDEMECPECGAKGVDWAWYWASENRYEAHPEYDGEAQSPPNPFEKVFRAVWDTLSKSGNDYEPEAYDGFERMEPEEDDEEQDPEMAGRLRKQNGYPIPQMYPFGVSDRKKHASNSPLFTVVIKCNDSMGYKDRDLWVADYKKGANEGTFQQFTKMLGTELKKVGLGYETDPVNNRFEPEMETAGTVRDEPLGSAYAVHVWDYVVEPGYLYRTATDQSLEQEYMSPHQAPFEQLDQALSVWEIAKHLDSIGEHQPRLWLALGLPSNCAIETVPEEERKSSFVGHIVASNKNIKNMSDFDGKNRIILKLQEVAKQYDKYGYGKHTVIPNHIEQLFRIRTSLDTMFYSKALGIPPDWQEDVACDDCSGFGKIGGDDCTGCTGSGYKSITRFRGKGALERREGLAVRAKRIEQILSKLPESKYENRQPHNALRMGLGLYWDVPETYQHFLEQKVKKMQEEDEARPDPTSETVMKMIRLKGSGANRYENEWRPVRYLEAAANDLRYIISQVRDFRNDEELPDGDLDELRSYYHEIVAIVDKAEWKLMDPAFKKRIRRAYKAAENWEKYGRPEEMIKERSRDISKALSDFLYDMEVGRIDKSNFLEDGDAIEASIFLEIQKLVTQLGAIGGVEAKHLWLRQNRYASFLTVKDEIETWLIQNAGIPANSTLERLVHPGTELPIDILQKMYKSLKHLNDSEELESERLSLVTRAVRGQNKK